MMKREFVLLAKTFEKQDIRGWFFSEKLDGIRAFWDGGISRGRPVKEISYSNIAKRPDDIATGLWSRYGNPIYAPKDWLNLLPKQPLDGELWIGRGKFQQTVSAVRKRIPGSEWADVKYRVFDSPGLDQFLTPGRITNPNFSREIVPTFAEENLKYLGGPTLRFWQVPPILLLLANDIIDPVPQKQLFDKSEIDKFVDELVEAGAEGAIARDPNCIWEPKRSNTCLKLKPYNDDEGKVSGWTPGEGKYLGMMGSLLISWKGKEFNLSGFTDEERKLGVHGTLHFPVGTTVTFRYRELTLDGIPREARYWRKRNED